MFDVSIHLLCTRKPGTLSRIIRDIKQVGLQYQSHTIDYLTDRSLIVINASGELNCKQERLVELFSEFDEVVEVQNVSVSRDGEELTGFKTTVSDVGIDALEPLSPAILLAAEKRLSDILGPIASLLVQTASQSSANVGELYLQLAQELDDAEERKAFLAVIKHSEQSQ